jgi:phage gpG-like protein
MPAPAVELKGARELRRALKQTHPAADKQLREELRDIGERIALVGARNAPRDTGALQRSIRPYVTARGVAVGSTLPYASVVHWGGTINPRGTDIRFERRPFLSDAIEDTADWALNQIADSFDRAARSAGWR